MIQPSQIREEIVQNKLCIYFENTDTLIAEISKERIITYNIQFQEALPIKTVEKIKHIAKYFDSGYFIADVENGIEPVPGSTYKAKFIRFMNFRPIIKRSDLCKIIDSTIDDIFVVNTTKENILRGYFQSNKNDFVNIPIDDVILFKEYHENMYYIQSGYVGNAMQWWALDSAGHTIDINKAHKYNETEVISILTSSKNDPRRNEQAWPVDYIDYQLNAHVTIIDNQYLENKLDNQYKLQ